VIRSAHEAVSPTRQQRRGPGPRAGESLQRAAPLRRRQPRQQRDQPARRPRIGRRRQRAERLVAHRGRRSAAGDLFKQFDRTTARFPQCPQGRQGERRFRLPSGRVQREDEFRLDLL
jgi:hypothetical protein